jgi:hypothetical protein
MKFEAALLSRIPEHARRYRWLLLLSVMIGTMASIMSSTIVNVAIPDMSHHFALGQERAQWVSSGFMVAMTASMLTTPWLLARYGYRHTYVGAMLLLMAGGVVGGFANHFPLVLAARVAEGLAAGIVQPIPAIIRRLQRVDEHRRHVEAGLVEDLLKTGRAGDVDLGQAVADHVQPHQQQAARGQHRAQRGRSRGRGRTAAAPRPCRRRPGCRAPRCPAECAPGRTAPACRRSPGCACRPG